MIFILNLNICKKLNMAIISYLLSLVDSRNVYDNVSIGNPDGGVWWWYFRIVALVASRFRQNQVSNDLIHFYNLLQLIHGIRHQFVLNVLYLISIDDCAICVVNWAGRVLARTHVRNQTSWGWILKHDRVSVKLVITIEHTVNVICIQQIYLKYIYFKVHILF